MKLIFTQPLKQTAMNKRLTEGYINYSLPLTLVNGLNSRAINWL
jgi:hypothetical protein